MLKKIVGALVLTVALGALQGCAYDPRTGTYVPCCVYPAYPAYGYYAPPVVGGVVIGGGPRGGWYRW